MSGRFLDDKSQKTHRRRQRRKLVLVTLSQWILGLLLAAVILVNLLTNVFQIVRYTGNAMEPSLSNGQTLMLRKTQNVEEGDIIAFYYNNQVLVRRVICQGGKQLTVENDGTLLINSQKMEEPYLQAPSLGQCNLTFPYHVQNGQFFVMGDNRAISMDSRLKEVGTVPEDRIIGKVILVF